MAKDNVTYTVQVISSPFGPADQIPWDQANWDDGLSVSKAIRVYNETRRWYNHGNSWSGHVRIVGSDDWTYTVAPPMPGARSTLSRLYHLDDL
jgi:hypothetical protein